MQAELPLFGSIPRDEVSAIDQLIQGALAYNTAGELKALLDFSRRLPGYSPFNCLLLHIQNPQATLVAPAVRWQQLNRTLKAGARPLLILAPMHPVMFVFDVADTEGDALPPKVVAALQNAFAVDGVISDRTWERLQNQCGKIHIIIENAIFGTAAGCVERVGGAFRVRLNTCHNRSEQFATLVHELAHVFCGHLGANKDDWWPPRDHLGCASEELEAEAVAWLVCHRFQVKPRSEQYLSSYLQGKAGLPPFSLETVLVTAGVIEEMANGRLPTRIREHLKKRERAASGIPRKR